jgi:hypothetical protein
VVASVWHTLTAMQTHGPHQPLDWRPYDPSWLVDLARDTAPLEPWLPEALAECTRYVEGCPAQIFFVDPSGPQWRPKHHIALEPFDADDVVVSVLEGNRIGSVEFLERLTDCADHFG